ncbi:hypothetical protein G6F42_028470 [Rhizopus arrhizus]|nr:hypothetical protein G6F32_015929 [Rhizopus arrhizus]KAG1058967.1 hypothetical protein G6F42_028470 [Rhizopus arrhizus]
MGKLWRHQRQPAAAARITYNANAAAYHARFPFAEKILTVAWTSDEEDGPEDEDGRTFIVKRPSFRSERVSGGIPQRAAERAQRLVKEKGGSTNY